MTPVLGKTVLAVERSSFGAFIPSSSTLTKDRVTIFHLRGLWANGVTSEVSQNFEEVWGTSLGKILHRPLQIS